MTVPPELKAILDRAAGRAHSADGPVMACLAEILARHEQMIRPEIKRQERERIAAEYRDARKAIKDSGGMNDDLLTDAIWQAFEQVPAQGPKTLGDPADIAALAYRHLASRLAAPAPAVPPGPPDQETTR